jgi:hypothetical protein
MKLLTNTIIALLISATFFACKKDASPAPSASVEGLFMGKYGFGNDVPDAKYTLRLKAGGIIQEIGQSSGNPTGQGTYVLNGNKLTADYKMLFAPYNDYFIVATYDAAAGTISGTWAYTKGGSDGGKFTVSSK